MSQELTLLVVVELLFPLALGLLWLGIKRQFEKRDRRDEKIARLLEEREKQKEGVVTERFSRFQMTLCDVKVKVDQIADAMHEKVSFDVCDHREDEVKQSLKDFDVRLRQGGI